MYNEASDTMFHNPMFTKLARICTYISLAAPLIASKSLFFPFITGKLLFFRLFTELALVAVTGAIAYGELPLPAVKKALKRPIFIIISVFMGLFALSALTAQVPSFAIFANFERGEGAWQMLHYFILFFLISVLFQGKKDWKRLLGTQALVGSLVALYAVGQAINWPAWIIDPATGRVSGTLGNPAYMGMYMGLSACFAFWVASQSRHTARLSWLLIGSFETVMFLAAQNRGSFAGAGAAAVIALCVWLLQEKRGTKAYFAAGFTGILIISGISALIFTVKGGNALADFQPRLWTWQSALAGVIERPLLGWGPENFPFVFDEYYNPAHYRIESWFDRAHSTPLEYLTGGGIPLFAAYAGIFIVLFAGILRRKKNDPSLPFFAALPAFYAINGLVLFETLPLYLPFFLLAGFVAAYTEGFENETATQDNRRLHGYAAAHLVTVTASALVIASLYATTYLPLRKNLLILDAMRTDGRTDVEIFKKHETALLYPSPTGNEEELQGLLTFTVSYFDYIQKNRLSSQISKEKIDNIMKFNAEWYAKGEPHAIGVKTLYMRVTGLLGAYQATKDAAYLAEADRLIAKGSTTAPTRIEFVRLAMASAALKGDRAAYAKELKKGKVLLPDLGWEPDMAKFVY